MAGTYHNSYSQDIIVAPLPSGLAVTYAHGGTDTLTTTARGLYVFGEGEEAIAFQREADNGNWLLRYYVDGHWGLMARRKE